MPSKNSKIISTGKEHGTSRQTDLMKESESYGAKYRKEHQGSDMIESTIHPKIRESKVKNKNK